MNITNQNQQDPENYTADQNKQDTNNTELSPNMSPVTYKKEEPLLVRAVVDNFSAFGVGSILYGLFSVFVFTRILWQLPLSYFAPPRSVMYYSVLKSSLSKQTIRNGFLLFPSAF